MRFVRRILWVCALVLSWGSDGVAEASGKGAGFVLLREGVGARAEAMGGAYTAVGGRSVGGVLESGGHRRAEWKGLSDHPSQFVSGNPADIWRMGI